MAEKKQKKRKKALCLFYAWERRVWTNLKKKKKKKVKQNIKQTLLFGSWVGTNYAPFTFVPTKKIRVHFFLIFFFFLYAFLSLSDNLFSAQLWYISLYKFSSIYQKYHKTLQWDLRLSLQGTELEHCKLHVSLFFLVKNKKNKY